MRLFGGVLPIIAFRKVYVGAGGDYVCDDEGAPIFHDKRIDANLDFKPTLASVLHMEWFGYGIVVGVM